MDNKLFSAILMNDIMYVQLGIGNSSSDGGKVAAGAFIETPTLVVIPGLAKVHFCSYGLL